MKQYLRSLFFSTRFIEIGSCILRVGIGMLMIIHGYNKLVGGPETWLMLGNAMQNVGIFFLPKVWGFAAAATEFFGGIGLVLGFALRVWSFLLAFVMTIAFIMHYVKGDPFRVYSHSLALIIVFSALFFMASGPFSVDAYLGKSS